MGSPEENIVKVVYNEDGHYLIVVGDNGVQLDQLDAEQLFVDLGHALQATHDKLKTESQLP